jgi:lysozyme family protein
MNFDQAFDILVDPQHEGGYVNDPHDPGGETKYGISKRSYPMEDIAGMTLVRAKAIYARDFWGPAGCDSVPDLLKYELFDFAVNTSAPGHPATAIKVLQLAAGSDVDGVLGPITLMRVQGMEPGRLFRRFIGYVIQYYTHILPERRDRYLAGWMNRVADNLLRT